VTFETSLFFRHGRLRAEPARLPRRPVIALGTVRHPDLLGPMGPHEALVIDIHRKWLFPRNIRRPHTSGGVVLSNSSLVIAPTDAVWKSPASLTSPLTRRRLPPDSPDLYHKCREPFGLSHTMSGETFSFLPFQPSCPNPGHLSPAFVFHGIPTYTQISFSSSSFRILAVPAFLLIPLRCAR